MSAATTAMIIAGLIGAGAEVGTAVYQAHNAKEAAKVQSSAADKAIAQTRADEAARLARQQPYIQAGAQSAQTLSNMLHPQAPNQFGGPPPGQAQTPLGFNPFQGPQTSNGYDPSQPLRPAGGAGTPMMANANPSASMGGMQPNRPQMNGGNSPIVRMQNPQTGEVRPMQDDRGQGPNSIVNQLLQRGGRIVP